MNDAVARKNTIWLTPVINLLNVFVALKKTAKNEMSYDTPGDKSDKRKSKLTRMKKTRMKS